MSTQGGEWGDGEKKAKIIDLCKQIYLTALEGGDENSISLWATISSIVNASYNEVYADRQKTTATENAKI